MEQFSFSRLRAYAECPRKYYHTYVAPDAKRPLPTETLAAGSAAHELLATAVLNGEYNQLPKPFNRIVARHVEEYGWDVYVERELIVNIGVAEFKCIIDLLLISPDGRDCLIIDWKGWARPEDDTQLSIYALAVHLAFGCVLEQATCYFASYNGGFRSEPVVINDFGGLNKKLRRIVADIAACGNDEEGYNLRPSNSCYCCPFVHRCASNIYAMPLLDLSLNELINAYYLADAAASQIKEQVEQLMEHEGLLEAYSESGVGFKRVISVSYRTAKRKQNGRA